MVRQRVLVRENAGLSDRLECKVNEPSRLRPQSPGDSYRGRGKGIRVWKKLRERVWVRAEWN
jgi:hypothetical protein